MSKEDRRRKAQGQRLATARKSAGYKSARQAALANGWNEGTYRTHEAGTRTIGLDDAERYAKRFRGLGVDISAQGILFSDDEDLSLDDGRQLLPIMGYVGAGGEIDTEFEQVPYDGIEQIELSQPIGLLDDPIGFIVRGSSMYPRFKEGEVLLVEREQPFATSSMVGDEAVVTTHADRRFVKRIMPGARPNSFSLESIDPNFAPMIDVRIRWASPVRMILPNIGLHRVTQGGDHQGKSKARRGRARSA